MKKIKLMTVIAMAGIAGLTARASAPTGLDIVTIKATALVQGDDTDKGDTTKFHVAKIKVVTKDVLALIANEYPGNAAAITNSGAKLAVDSFFAGDFEVLNSTNGVILADAGQPNPANTNDDYDLFIDTDNAVATGSDSDKGESDSWVVATEVEYDSADESSFFDVEGISAVKSKFPESDNSVNS